MDAYHTLEFDGGADDKARFQRRMLERFLSQPHAISKDDLDYLLDKIDQLSVRAAGVQASTAPAQASAA